MAITRRDFLKLSGAIATGCAGIELAPDADMPDGGRLDENDAGSGFDGGRIEPGDDAGMSMSDAGMEQAFDAGNSDAGCTSDESTGPVEPTELGSIPQSAAFPLGVMAGDMLPDRAMLWTRYDGMRPLTVRVVEIDAMGNRLRQAYEGEVTPSGYGIAKVDVPSVRPGRTYRYAFLEHDGSRPVARSRVGRFRTAPSATACPGVVRFGGASCNNRNGAPFEPLTHAADAELDFFIHCGDHVYADSANTLSQYRGVYDNYWRVPGLTQVHASTGLFTTWDDHEVFNNWNPEVVRSTAAGRDRLAAATQAFFEHRAFRRNSEDRDRIWRKFKWGRTAEIFMLDVRSERLPSTRSTAGAQFISDAQMRWLKRSLRESDAVFKFVVTSKPITGRVDRDLTRDDFWEGYPAQREELLSFITDNSIDGLWFLSGDVHYACIAKVEADGPYRRLREVYMGPAGSGDPGDVNCDGGGQSEVTIRRLNYARFTADPFMRRLTIEFIGAAGGVICRRNYDV
jgi:phosphodiesterase/alkaline phosphatase D-like protein